MKPTLASVHNCTGCSACVDSCNKHALSTFMASDGHIYVSCDASKCVLCHRCEKVCPVVNGIEYSSNQNKASQPYSVRCSSEEIYKKSTSGGAFAALALQFIKDGGYVCGAVFDENHVKHIVSNRIDDVGRMQGSKYLQSSLEGIYRKISSLLKQGKKVLFCGMGCQGAALCSFFKKHQNRELLYVIDMICGGVPSYLLAKSFLENETNYKQIVGFRRKGEYVLSCLNQKDEVEFLNRRTLPIVGFGTGLTNRFSCSDCQFCGIERLSDMTIGDFWGPKSDDGLQKSVAIIHTDKGKMLLESSSQLDIAKTDWTFVLHNYRCVIGKSSNRFRLRRKLLAWNFKHLSYNQLCGIYGCKFNQPIWLALKVYNKLVKIIEHFYIKHQLKVIVRNLDNNKKYPPMD